MGDGPGIGHRSSASRSARAIFDTLSKKSSAEFVEPFFQITYLWVGFRKRARLLVCGSCLVTASKPTEQVGACRMHEVVVRQLTAGEERTRIDDAPARLRAPRASRGPLRGYPISNCPG